MDTITKTGQDMPKKIAILDSGSSTVVIRQLPIEISETHDIDVIEEWLEEQGYHDVEYMYGDITIDIDN